MSSESGSQYEFKTHTQISYIAAQKIVPFIVDVIGVPSRVVDLGGGGGGWLKAFLDLGTQDAILIDDPIIQPEDVIVDFKFFKPVDLSKVIPAPIVCDLAMTIECLEHLPESKAGAAVDFLTQSADAVLFSAAIPGQGGTKHINEQYPSYWRQEFENRGFRPLDAIRPQIIFDDSIPFWLRQNLFLYFNEKAWNKLDPKYKEFRFLPHDFELIHSPSLTPFRSLVSQIPSSFKRAIKTRSKRAL